MGPKGSLTFKHLETRSIDTFSPYNYTPLQHSLRVLYARSKPSRIQTINFCSSKGNERNGSLRIQVSSRGYSSSVILADISVGNGEKMVTEQYKLATGLCFCRVPPLFIVLVAAGHRCWSAKLTANAVLRLDSNRASRRAIARARDSSISKTRRSTSGGR